MPTALQIVLAGLTIVWGLATPFTALIKDEKMQGVIVGAFFASYFCLIMSVIFQ